MPGTPPPIPPPWQAQPAESPLRLKFILTIRLFLAILRVLPSSCQSIVEGLWNGRGGL
jgi:hypothetical protein